MSSGASLAVCLEVVLDERNEAVHCPVGVGLFRTEFLFPDRKAEFPTGLAVPTAEFDIANPQADSEHVEESAVVLAPPDRPVAFCDMDDPDDTVEAGVVMLLLADESEGYTAFFSNLANLIQHPQFAEAVEAGDPELIFDLIESECL